MRPILNGPLHWVALGVGLLVLAGVISVAVWLVQRDDGPGAVPRASDETPAGLETRERLPGSSTRNTTGDGESGSAGPASSGATANDSVELEVQRGGSSLDEAEAGQSEGAVGTRQGLTAADDATLSDSVEVEVQQGEATPPPSSPGHAASVQDSTDLTMSDSAELSVQPGQPVPRRGSGDSAAIADTPELVVRDASGNIKQQQTVR